MNDEIQLKLNYFSRLKHQTARQALQKMAKAQSTLWIFKAALVKGKLAMDKFR